MSTSVMVLPYRQPLNWAVMLWPALGPWGAGTVLQVAGQGTISASQTQVLCRGPTPPVSSLLRSSLHPWLPDAPCASDREWGGVGWDGYPFSCGALIKAVEHLEGIWRASWGCETSTGKSCCELTFSHVGFWC